MLEQILGIISALLIVFVAIPYYLSVFRGRSKPQRMAMFIFFVLAFISFAGQWAEGATASLWFSGALLVNQVFILLISFKYGMGGYSRVDIFSLAASAGILTAWYITESSALAVILVVCVNFIAKVLVALKVRKHPQTELLYSWALSAVASLFAVASVGEMKFTLILPPLHNAVTVGIIAWIIYRGGNRSLNPFH